MDEIEKIRKQLEETWYKRRQNNENERALLKLQIEDFLKSIHGVYGHTNYQIHMFHYENKVAIYPANQETYELWCILGYTGE